MSGSEPPLNPPTSVATKLEILDGTFVLTYDRLNSEATIQPMRDDATDVIAVLTRTPRIPSNMR